MKRRCASEVRNPHAVSSGAALVEFVVLAIIMVPLLFAIPMIGKLIDVEQTAVQASRYAAWETTVGVSAADGNALRGRFFADPAAPIATGAAGAGKQSTLGRRTRLAGRAREGHPHRRHVRRRRRHPAPLRT